MKKILLKNIPLKWALAIICIISFSGAGILVPYAAKAQGVSFGISAVALVVPSCVPDLSGWCPATNWMCPAGMTGVKVGKSAGGVIPGMWYCSPTPFCPGTGNPLVGATMVLGLFEGMFITYCGAG